MVAYHQYPLAVEENEQILIHTLEGSDVPASHREHRQRAAGREDADPDASELAHMDRVDFRCASAAAKATEELVSAGHVVEYRD